MRRVILLSIIILVSFTGLIYGQKKVKIPNAVNYVMSQKNGVTASDLNYNITVTYDTTTLTYRLRENSALNKNSVTKKTDRYVIAKNRYGNYTFFDIKKKQLYSIDYYKSRYILAGYGQSKDDIKQVISEMMKKFIKGESQKDVIQHLIKQTEYDF
ncbi:hypothetical protein [Aquimarina celericrescens]|uniref:DUF4468 domain-containing protein n=1 Tax=Aquimarina celericrescens TaxID=1964542 RepID=A0ABW5ATF6_9FLAO|nr:hypothetical protein [Aquimarina celericrescens]